MKLTKMDIEVCNNSGNITKTFKIQGSNDESTYEDIDEISIAFPPNILSNYTFKFTPEKKYKSFRIYSNEINYAGAGGYACTFSQIKIYGISFMVSYIFSSKIFPSSNILILLNSSFFPLAIYSKFDFSLTIN